MLKTAELIGNNKENISSILKLMELKDLFDMYQNMSVSVQANGGDWKKEMLMSIKPKVKKNNQNKIDMLIKLIEIKKIMSEI